MSAVTKVTGRAIPLPGDDIDTDRIIPARYLRCVSFDGLGAYAFEDDRRQNPDHNFNDDRYNGSSLLFCGRNFGCGSSREHAPQSLNRWGIKAIIGESFAEIFFGNCLAMGVPCATTSAADATVLREAAAKDVTAEFVLDVVGQTVTGAGLTISVGIPDGARAAFLEGTWNATSVLLDASDAIDRTAQSLPYVTGFGP
ncbi:MAG TPA: isopropylmalate isomerase [Lentisphaeria bacterium]|jgi:3-isopropylmalate/(R)-2-methylmalate dehydratase small subunit|nr:isopropylmalate isomerase [Lentisphaeria bacterium]